MGLGVIRPRLRRSRLITPMNLARQRSRPRQFVMACRLPGQVGGGGRKEGPGAETRPSVCPDCDGQSAADVNLIC